MNGNGSLTISETATKRVRKTKASARKPKGRSRNGSTKPGAASPDLPAAGTLAGTKAVLRVRDTRRRLINQCINSRDEWFLAQPNRCIIEHPQAFVLVRHNHH